MKLVALPVSLILFLSFSGRAQTTITVATYQYATNTRIDNIKPLAEHLSTACACKASVKSYASVSAMLTGMEDKESDLVLMNTFGYLLLKPQQQDYTPLTTLQVAKGKQSTYQSAIVIRKELGITSFETLKQNASSLTLRLVNPGSTSGNLAPRLGMASVGIEDADKAFKSITYSKNHSLTLQEVANGKFDVGAFGSEEYTKALKLDSTLADKVTLLWMSSDIPLGPVMIKKSLDKKLSQCIKKELLALHSKNKAALESVKAGWTEAIPADKYILVSPKYYQQWLDTMGGVKALPIIQQFAN